MLCSFQKEESVLVDELVRIAPDARIVTIDTGVLFPETLATWRAFEERFGIDVAIEDATGDWTGPQHCCGERKVAALERALGGADAWITGIRREQSPTRADAQPVEFDDKRGIWKFNPLVEWTEKDLWRRIHERDLPYHPLHDTATPRSAARPAPTRAAAARAAGPGSPRPSVELARMTADHTHRTCALASARARGRGHPRDPRGRGRA